MSTGISLHLAPFIDGLPDRELRRIFRSCPQGAARIVTDLETILRARQGADGDPARALLARLAPMLNASASKQLGHRTRPRGTRPGRLTRR